MKKSILLTWAACALFATSLSAQTSGIPAPYGINDATPIDTVTQTFEYNGASGKKAQLIVTTMIWGRSSGGIELSIDAGAVSISGDVDLFTTMATSEIYDFIGRSAVDSAITLGYATCPSSGSAGTGLTLASCVTRSGVAFSVSGASLVRRAYSYSCPSSGRTITLTGATGTTTCSGGADATTDVSGLQ